MVAVLLQGYRSLSAGQAFDSPLLTPTVVPAPTVVPVPPCHAQAMAFVAREHDIPIERLIAGSHVSNQDGQWTSDGQEEWIELPFIQRRICYVKVHVKDGDEVYGVALDEQGQVVDLEKLRTLERQTSHARCGKLDPTLCEQLPALAQDEQVEVAIWLTDIDVGAIYDAVAASYPPSLQPQKGLPFDIDHPDYEKAFWQVQDLLPGAYREKEEPVVAFLEAAGFKSAYTSRSAPIVFAELPRNVLATLVDREEVAGNKGYTGSHDVRVAVVEDNPVDFGNQYLDHAIGGTGPASLAWYPDEMSHPTKVAGVIAMRDHPLYQGVAPNVLLCSADAGDLLPVSNVAVASDWAIWDCVAYILNCSFGGDALWYNFYARYYDHVVFYDRRTVVASTGNDSGAVTSPATGYNVISVGSFDDHDNPAWADDTISAFSNYQGPGSREKPEVVAAGERVCTTDLSGDDVGCDSAGTSLAAPQVSGLAALLIQKTGLYLQPELLKAIIMASAVHNIEGDSRVSDRDGVGGIDAALAYKIADHGRYDVATEGWYDYKTVHYADFDANGYLHYYVPVSRGEKVRVVLVFDSQPNISDPYNGDQLYADLDLRVYRPNGSEKTASFGGLNNFEIVEFTADETGTYDVRVQRWSWSTDYEQMGIAWTKDATYLPDLRNQDGWASEFYVRNNGAQPRNVTIHYFDANGNPTPKVSDVCYLNQNQECWIPVSDPNHNRIPAGTSGSAIVGGGEDVSVVVETQKNGVTERTNYTGILPDGGSGSLGWEETGPVLYAPVIKRSYGSRSSTIRLTNVGSQATTVWVDFYNDDPGSGRTLGPYTLNANKSMNLSPNGSGSGGCAASGTICSARIRSSNGQPLAGVVREQNDADGLVVTTHNLFSAGDEPIYFPVAKYRFNNMTTGLRIQNVGSSAATVVVSYYQQDGTFQCSRPSVSVPPLAAHTFMPDISCPPEGFLGSVVATTNPPGQSLVGMANEASESAPSRKKAYSSFQGGSHTAYGALVYRTYYQGGYTWDSGIVVQNLSDQAANVRLYYYYLDGSPAGSPVDQQVNGRGIGVFFAPVGGLKGSVVITADQDIAAAVNVTNNAPTGDTHAIYNASNR
jgi:hypothetical protein